MYVEMSESRVNYFLVKSKLLAEIVVINGRQIRDVLLSIDLGRTTGVGNASGKSREGERNTSSQGHVRITA